MAGPQQPVVSYSAERSAIDLRYTEHSPIVVRGPASGRTYQFSATQAVQAVDARDAQALLQTRFFRRA